MQWVINELRILYFWRNNYNSLPVSFRETENESNWQSQLITPYRCKAILASWWGFISADYCVHEYSKTHYNDLNLYFSWSPFEISSSIRRRHIEAILKYFIMQNWILTGFFCGSWKNASNSRFEKNKNMYDLYLLAFMFVCIDIYNKSPHLSLSLSYKHKHTYSE